MEKYKLSLRGDLRKGFVKKLADGTREIEVADDNADEFPDR